jgi:lysophospholipase L1-like esterase
MSESPQANKWVGALIVTGTLTIFSGIMFLADSFSDSPGLTHWINSKRILADHKKDLLARIAENPDFTDIDVPSYVSEMQELVKMGNKKDISSWISFRTFTPNLSGKYINTNDFGMRSKLALSDMIQKARSNKVSGVKNVILIGGSAAFGYGSVDDDQTISGFLSSFLKKEEYQVFNLAQGGYTSYMELFIMSTLGIYFEPDIIIVLDGYADVNQLTNDSNQSALSMGIWTGTPLQKDPSQVFQFYLENLSAICKLAKFSNAEVIIALQPLSGFENDSTVDAKKIKNVWSIYPKARETAKSATEINDAKFLDLSVIFKNDTNSGDYFFDQSHLSVAGQRKIAKALSSTIKNLALNSNQEFSIPFRKRKMLIQKILNASYDGKYKTADNY